MPPISCLIYTLNEEVNLPSCLASLAWCDDVIVVDSFSNDRTEEIARTSNARFVQNRFGGFGEQRNWSFENVAIKHPWALILDADERVPAEMVAELERVLTQCPEDVSAFRLRRRFHLWGRWLKWSSLYPTWVVRVIRLGKVRYVNRGHAETQTVDGRIESLESDLIDENHKGVDDWWQRQVRYAAKEAEYELAQPAAGVGKLISFDPFDRREAVKSLARRLPLRPLWFFVYAYVWRLGFLDGFDGFRFCVMKATYHFMIGVKKRELRSAANRKSH